MSLQSATLYWGEKLQSDNEFLPTGLQNALTPNSQNYRNFAAPILLVSTTIIGIIFFNILTGVIGIVTTIILSNIFRKFFPKKNSEYYYNKMLNILNKKKELGKRKNRDDIVIAADEIIDLLKSNKNN